MTGVVGCHGAAGGVTEPVAVIMRCLGQAGRKVVGS